MKKKTALLSVRGLHKKFSKDIHYNLFYGLKDLVFDILHLPNNYMNLRKKEFWANSDINLDLFAGEILGIVGANGSGKTTLMRLISGIFPIEQGELFGMNNLKITPIFALRAGMQPLFSGRENIYIKGSMHGMNKEEIDSKMEFISTFSELGEHLDSPLGNYSSGMGARLAFAIAIATEPDVFIIDEALAVGDSVFKAKCYEYLKDYVKQPNKGVLFVSNNIRKILKVASRVLIMEDGKIIHESEDISAALHFYIENCLKALDPHQKMMKMQKVKEYDL